MKEWLKNKMKDDIKSSISIELNKISVNIKFNEELSLLDVCELKVLSDVGIPKNVFEFPELTDDELVRCYDKMRELNYDSEKFNLWLSQQYFTLSDMDYDYEYDYMRRGNMMRVSGKLVYKSHDDFFDGKGKFLIDFYMIFILPEDSTGKLDVYSCLLTITAGIHKTWTKAFDGLIDNISLADNINDIPIIPICRP